MLLVRDFLYDLVKRCKRDRITVSAGHLAYVSLLSLVPFIVVIFSMLSAFPAFSDLSKELESFIFTNFLPQAGDQLQVYLAEFVGNASKMGTISILSLVVVALLLISNIDKTLNLIWQTHSNRPAIYTLAIYWMVLTLGPILMGFSLAISSYLMGLATFADEYTPGATTVLLKLGTFAASVLAFFIVYMVVPTKRVKAKHALAGALLASVLFEISRKGFSIYISSFDQYQVIYGALAAVPILFVWVYLSWIVVLVGAEFTHELDVFTEKMKALKLKTEPASSDG